MEYANASSSLLMDSELRGTLCKFLVEALNVFLPALAFRDVIVRFQNGNGLLVLVLAARDHRLATTTSVPSALFFLSSPSQRPARSNSARTSSIGIGNSVGKNWWTVLSDCLFCPPTVQFLSPSIPVRNDVTHIPDENGVMREIEQAGLLGSFHHLPLEFVAGLQKLLFDTAPDRAEPGEK